MLYVVHFCRNKKCNKAWIDKDLTHSTSIPPQWKYCRECCEKLGIDFDKQTPDSNLTKEELKKKNKLRKRFDKVQAPSRWTKSQQQERLTLHTLTWF